MDDTITSRSFKLILRKHWWCGTTISLGEFLLCLQTILWSKLFMDSACWSSPSIQGVFTHMHDAMLRQHYTSVYPGQLLSCLHWHSSVPTLHQHIPWAAVELCSFTQQRVNSTPEHTLGSCCSVFNSLCSKVVRGSTRWSYSIMHDRTPGLVSTSPATPCPAKCFSSSCMRTLRLRSNSIGPYSTCTYLPCTMHSLITLLERELLRLCSKESHWVYLILILQLCFS